MTESLQHLRQHSHHHSKHSGKRLSYKKFEKFITRYLFILLGITFVIAGVVFLLSEGGQGKSFVKEILAMFTLAVPEITQGNLVYSFYYWSLLLWLLPGLLFLILPFFFDKQSLVFASISAFIGTFWVFVVNIKVLSFDFIKTGNCYPTLWVGMAITLALSLLPLWHAYKMKHGSLQLLIILLFFISLLFLINNYEWHYYQDFFFLVLFTGTIIILCYKTDKLTSFYINYFLNILLIAVFWLRRLVMRDSGELVSTYIVISSLFYVALFISGLRINLSQRKAGFELISVILMLINTLYYWGSVLFVLQKYGYQRLEGPFTMILALFNGTLIYYSPKTYSAFTRRLYIVVILPLQHDIPVSISSELFYSFYFCFFSVAGHLCKKCKRQMGSLWLIWGFDNYDADVHL